MIQEKLWIGRDQADKIRNIDFDWPFQTILTAERLEKTARSLKLDLCQSFNLGLAVSALAAVEQPKTVAIAKTAEVANPSS